MTSDALFVKYLSGTAEPKRRASVFVHNGSLLRV